MGSAMLDGKLMFPSEYVAAVEFKGHDVTLTIQNVELADLRMKDNSTKKKPVLHFRETPKKLVLNKTNASAIADHLGSEARKWIGKKVTLYPTTCSSFGEIVACVRIRPKSNGAAAVPPPLSEDVTADGEPLPADISPEEAAAIADREAQEASNG